MLREKRGGSDDRLQFIPNCQRRINDIGSECHVFMFKPTLYSTATMGSDSSNKGDKKVDKEDDDHVTWKVCKPNKVQVTVASPSLSHSKHSTPSPLYILNRLSFALLT